MSLNTVTGPIAASELGLTLAHEHLFLDLRNQFTEFEDPEKQRISRQEVRMSNLGVLRRNPYAVKDNLLLDDVSVAIEEISFFKELGGRTVVDCTSIGIHRNVATLRDVALSTQLNIIAGSGYYTYDTHPPGMDAWSAEGIAEEIVRDLTVGIDGTDIKAGVIGEIGTSEPVRCNEKKNLLAAALAYQQYPAAIYVHTYPWGKGGLEAAQILLEARVPPGKIVICHVDVEFDLQYLRALLGTGVFIEFDDFGKEFSVDRTERSFAGGGFARDIERVQVIKQLVEWGHEKQILVTNDICMKSMLRRYGGWGYDHLLRHIVPMMLEEGIAQNTVDQILIGNPAALLDVP